MNSVGILSGGGLGRVLAHWIIEGVPDVDVTGWDVARFRADQSNPAYRRDRTTEILGTVYAATPGQVAAHGARPAVARPRAPGRATAATSRGQRLGGRRLVRRPAASHGRSRAAVLGAPSGSSWRPSTARSARASSSWTCRSWRSSWCTAATPASCSNRSRRRRRRRAGVDHLHPVAQRRRHDRGGPDGHQARRRAVLRGRLGHRAAPRARPGCAATSRRRARLRHRRHVGLRAAQRAGPALARAAADAHRRRPVQRGLPVPRRARDRSASPACCACGSPTSASSATSCTSRPSRPSHVYDASWRPARRSACGTPGSRRWRACAWRRATATTATTSTTPTARSRRARLRRRRGKPGGFIGKDAVLARKAAGPLDARLVQVLLKDPEPLLFHAEVVRATGGGRLRPRRVVRLDARRRGRAGDDRAESW